SGLVAANNVTVNATIDDVPKMQASASADKESGQDSHNDPNDTAANQKNKFEGSFAFMYGEYTDNATAVISAGAQVDAKADLTVKAEGLNEYTFDFLINLVEPFTENAKFTTDQGTQSVSTDDIVEVKNGHTGGGDVGNWIKYKGTYGSPDSVHLSTT